MIRGGPGVVSYQLTDDVTNYHACRAAANDTHAPNMPTPATTTQHRNTTTPNIISITLSLLSLVRDC